MRPIIACLLLALVYHWPVRAAAEGGEAGPPATEIAGKADLPLRVELLEAGEGPRRVLRLRPRVGAEEELTMTMKMGMEIEFEGLAMPVPEMPAMIMVLRTVVREVGADGEVRFDQELTRAELAAAPAGEEFGPQLAELERALGTLVGMKGDGVVTSRGVHTEFELRVPEGVAPSAVQMMQNLREAIINSGCPLPEEEVGAGARWRVVRSISTGAIKGMRQVAEYRLASIGEDGSLRVEVEIAQTADRQVMELPDLPEGVTSELRSMESEGRGTMTITPDRINARGGRLSSTSEMESDVVSGGERFPMKHTMRIELELDGGSGGSGGSAGGAGAGER